MKKIELSKLDHNELLKTASALQDKLHKVTHDLLSTRQKLSNARKRARKMKDTVQFQRQRILELYQ